MILITVMINMKEVILVHIYLFLMNKCTAVNGYNIFHTYGPVIEIVKSYEN